VVPTKSTPNKPCKKHDCDIYRLNTTFSPYIHTGVRKKSEVSPFVDAGLGSVDFELGFGRDSGNGSFQLFTYSKRFSDLEHSLAASKIPMVTPSFLFPKLLHRRKPRHDDGLRQPHNFF
jgi:hypothetical protein